MYLPSQIDSSSAIFIYPWRVHESMTFNPAENYGDEKICLSVEGEFQERGLTAYCSPDSEGKTYFEDGTEAGGPVTNTHGAPFKVDIVLYGSVYPDYGEMKDIRDEIGEAISAQFEEKMANIFNEMQDAEDPIEAVESLSAEDL